MNDELTDNQKRVLMVIERWFAQHNRPPEFKEIRTVTGQSLSTIYETIQKLIKLGYVQRVKVKNSPRGLRLTRKHYDWTKG